MHTHSQLPTQHGPHVGLGRKNPRVLAPLLLRSTPCRRHNDKVTVKKQEDLEDSGILSSHSQAQNHSVMLCYSSLSWLIRVLCRWGSRSSSLCTNATQYQFPSVVDIRSTAMGLSVQTTFGLGMGMSLRGTSGSEDKQ